MEKLDQIKGSSEDQISVSGQTRSYTCNFCKRGFSNAQALGGHMNIHRRDRARIRQLFEENKNNNDQVSSDTNTMIKNINPPFDINDRPYSASLSEDKSSRGSTTTSFQLERLSEQQSGVTNNKNPYSMVRDEDQLYHEQAMGSNRGNMVFGGDEVAQQIPFFAEESSDKVIPAEKRTEELDLELRLGPERRDASTKLSTREFF